MTVKELCELLSTHNPAFEVLTEGCDCEGKATGVVIKGRTSPYILITRKGGWIEKYGADPSWAPREGKTAPGFSILIHDPVK